VRPCRWRDGTGSAPGRRCRSVAHRFRRHVPSHRLPVRANHDTEHPIVSPCSRRMDDISGNHARHPSASNGAPLPCYLLPARLLPVPLGRFATLGTDVLSTSWRFRVGTSRVRAPNVPAVLAFERIMAANTTVHRTLLIVENLLNILTTFSYKFPPAFADSSRLFLCSLLFLATVRSFPAGRARPSRTEPVPRRSPPRGSRCLGTVLPGRVSPCGFICGAGFGGGFLPLPRARRFGFTDGGSR
jgi:hypothetical protein